MEAAAALSPVPSATSSPLPSPAPSKSLIAKLVKAIGALENVKKEGWNQHSQYKYVTIDSLAAIARKALSKEGLVLLADMVERRTSSIHTAAGREAWAEDVMLRFTLTDGESSIQFSMGGSGHDSSDKALPKSISNARKYCLLTLMNLGGEDPETETLETTRSPVAGQPSQKAAQPAFSAPSPVLVRPMPNPTPPLVHQAQPALTDPLKPAPAPISAATERQVKAILAVGRTLNLDEPTIHQLIVEHYGHPISDLTRKEASNFLDLLKREQNSAHP